MDIDYVGSWYDDNVKPYIEELIETLEAIDENPLNFSFGREEITERAKELGFEKEWDIARAKHVANYLERINE